MSNSDKSKDDRTSSQAQHVPESSRQRLQFIPPELVIPSIIKALELVVLVGIYSTISQLTLSPVYGSTPASLYHHRAVTGVFLLSWLARGFLSRWIPDSILTWLPVIAFWIPRYQYILFKQSSHLGAFWGPVVTEAATFYPLALISMYATAEIVSHLDLSRYGERVAEIAPAFGSYAVYSVTEKLSAFVIPRVIGGSIVMTRVGLQLVIATIYAMLFPSRLLVVSVPPILFSATQNVHLPLGMTTDLLNSTLQLEGYMLHERHESLTGYISVLENFRDGFRVMRCDHSLLGGEWTAPTSGALVAEPIYGVFAMLEAVRLVEPTEDGKWGSESEKKALNIGLGIGTTPAALITHGVDTTILEIDPLVYEYATKYFGLPSNHTAIIGDAVSFINEATKAAPATSSYDYIIHDVFTGGTEPVDLFTYEFFRDLKTLLKPEGVIAINYAGDLTLPSAGLVIRTIQSVFPTCRLFREDEKPDDDDNDGQKQVGDFTNMVMFCKKTNLGPLTFRNPVEADYLGSGARKSFLWPQHEISPEALTAGSTEMMKRGQQHALAKWQAKSVIEHWEVMRAVLPHSVWENW